MGSSLPEGNFLGRNVSNSPSDVSFFFLMGTLMNKLLQKNLKKKKRLRRAERQLEALANLDLKSSTYMPKPRSYFESQVSKLYNNEILRMFKREVERMYSCFCT